MVHVNLYSNLAVNEYHAIFIDGNSYDLISWMIDAAQSEWIRASKELTTIDSHEGGLCLSTLRR